jgi:hypothetical protein
MNDFINDHDYIIKLNLENKYIGTYFDKYIYNKFKFIKKPSKSYYPYDVLPKKSKE